MRRPERVLHFAWNPTMGGAVEPPTAEATTGWATDQRPPAPYVNALFNNYGQWFDFLRGPSLSRWSRVALPGTLTGALIAADQGSVEGANVLRRLVVAGNDGTDNCLYVSFRGDAWTRRTNFAGGAPAGTFTRLYHLFSSWFLLSDDGTDGTIWVSDSDGVSSTALDGSHDWHTSGTFPMSADTRGVALCAGFTGAAVVYACRTALYLNVTGGAGAFTALAVSGNAPDTGHGLYRDLAFLEAPVHTDSAVVAISSDGDVIRGTILAGSPGGFASITRLVAASSVTWRLSQGEAGEVVAWIARVGVHSLWRSVDFGATWLEIEVTETRLHDLTALVYRDGTWVASTLDAPHLWSSNDLLGWTPLVVPVVDDGDNAIVGVTFSEGGWVALRDNVVLNGERAVDPAPGAWTIDPTPTTLGNAGWLAGVRITLTAPTDGQVLAYDNGTGRYVPTTPAKGAALVGPFALAAVAASVEADPADVSPPQIASYGPVAGLGGIVAIVRAGSLTGLSAFLSGTPHGSDCRVVVLDVTASPVLLAALTITLTDGGAQVGVVTVAAGDVPVAAGALVAVGVQTGSGWTSTTVSLVATLEFTPS